MADISADWAEWHATAALVAATAPAKSSATPLGAAWLGLLDSQHDIASGELQARLLG